jgi:NAD(P)-dependent dehydrogenase (short-subunit alcohol dehydrogenase family)
VKGPEWQWPTSRPQARRRSRRFAPKEEGIFVRADVSSAADVDLCSDEASFVTGIAMPVDGRFVAR